ncbi:MAG: hypothetical protein RR471_12365, partial [Bacteroides sp.]
EAKGFGMKVLEAKYKPLQLGLFVAAFCAVCGLSFGWGGGAYADGGIYNRGEYGWVLLGGLSVFIWMCLLVMAGRVMRVEDPVRQVGVYVLYPWYKNKKLTLSALFLREAR